ncbi:MAG: hypothetical protein J6D37_08960 [Clostridia bacterium]|nr:hypothetical protein [Clostridia bacterium]
MEIICYVLPHFLVSWGFPIVPICSIIVVFFFQSFSYGVMVFFPADFWLAVFEDSAYLSCKLGACYYVLYLVVFVLSLVTMIRGKKKRKEKLLAISLIGSLTMCTLALPFEFSYLAEGPSYGELHAAFYYVIVYLVLYVLLLCFAIPELIRFFRRGKDKQTKRGVSRPFKIKKTEEEHEQLFWKDQIQLSFDRGNRLALFDALLRYGRGSQQGRACDLPSFARRYP